MGLEIISASAISGIVSQCIVHPLDTLRTHLMVSRGGNIGSVAGGSSSGGGSHGLISTTQNILSRNGIFGFYRGFSAALLLQAPAITTYLSVYEWSKHYLSNHYYYTFQKHDDDERHHHHQHKNKHGNYNDDPLIHLSAGMMAEIVSAVFWVPMEVLKQRAQLRNKSTFVVLKDLLKYEHPLSLFKGYGLTVGVYGPYSAIFFATYEASKKNWRVLLNRMDHEEQALPMKANLSSGAVAAAIAGAITTPLDVIKTRLQTQGDKKVLPEQKLYKNTWHATKTIAKEEGLRAFLRGMEARILWKMPGTAICMACYEHLKQIFRKVDAIRE